MIHPSLLHIKAFIDAALMEDMPYGHDLTTALTIPPTATASAHMIARNDGVLAGLNIALTAFTTLSPDIIVTTMKQDGETIKSGDTLAQINGAAHAILGAERVALNLVSHLSGIASLTAQYVAKTNGTMAKITCTRKTLPRLRVFQKYAVTCGGGSPHRNSLDDAIMIKDNHIAVAGDITTALDIVRAHKSHTKRIEIEVDNLDQLKEVLSHGGADIVLLDNMDIETLKKAVSMTSAHTIVTEASGGVILDTVNDIAKTGVSFISVGALTHSSSALDIGLDINMTS